MTFHSHQRVQINVLSNERELRKSRAQRSHGASCAQRHRGVQAADRRPTYLREMTTGHSAGQTADGCGQGVSRPRAPTAALQTMPSLGACVFMTPESRVSAAPAASAGSRPCTQPRSRLFELHRRPLRHVNANPRRAGQTARQESLLLLRASITLVRLQCNDFVCVCSSPFFLDICCCFFTWYSYWDSKCRSN